MSKKNRGNKNSGKSSNKSKKKKASNNQGNNHKIDSINESSNNKIDVNNKKNDSLISTNDKKNNSSKSSEEANISKEVVENKLILNEVDVNKQKLKKRLTVGSIVLASVGIPTYMNSLIEKCESRAYPGQTIESIDVTGYTKEDVAYIIDNLEKECRESLIKINVGDNVYEKNIADLDFSISNKSELTDEIMKYKKDKSFIEKGLILINSEIFKSFEDKSYDIKFTYNEDVVDEFVSTIKTENDKDKKELNVVKDDNGEYKYIDGVEGFNIDESKLKSEILRVIGDNISGEKVLNFEGDVIALEYKKEDLALIDTKLSSYTTVYSTGSGRSRNVELGAQRSNAVVFPGESFSLNEVLLERTKQNGYKEAPEYRNGQVVQGVGGGICQVSTTMYGAMLRAGLLPTERHPHSMTVNYAPIGLDSAIAGNVLDLKFENTLTYPVYINAYTSGGKLTIEFWSNSKALNGITYEPKSYPKSSLRADAYLYGYDTSGNQVYKKYLGQSTYRPKQSS